MNLLERIDHWAVVSPEAIAHVSDGRTLTYGDLCRRSDALAAHLAERFGDDRAPIAALGHREPELLLSFLRRVQPGRTYLRSETHSPVQHRQRIRGSASSGVVLK